MIIMELKIITATLIASCALTACIPDVDTTPVDTQTYDLIGEFVSREECYVAGKRPEDNWLRATNMYLTIYREDGVLKGLRQHMYDDTVYDMQIDMDENPSQHDAIVAGNSDCSIANLPNMIQYSEEAISFTEQGLDVDVDCGAPSDAMVAAVYYMTDSFDYPYVKLFITSDNKLYRHYEPFDDGQPGYKCEEWLRVN